LTIKNSIRFHLETIAKRFSMDELEYNEKEYLALHPVDLVDVPPPQKDLALIVVIPAYNEEDFIGLTLNSIIQQEFPLQQLEVIVVDNGSKDRTRCIVNEYKLNSELPIILISQPARGCLNAVKMGMDAAIQRFSRIASPRDGIIATIDSDNQVGHCWTDTIHNNMVMQQVDMLRGTTQLVPSLSPESEALLKIFCDLGNRANAFTELAILRISEMLSGISQPFLPQWLPRITGPNFAISRSAYVAVGGLDPREPGDQASHLANPLLQLGGTFLISEDSHLLIETSQRFSNRIENQGLFFGVSRFGNMIELATRFSEASEEVKYPNPAILEAGLHHIKKGLSSNEKEARTEVQELAHRLLSSPTDPNRLFELGHSLDFPRYISLKEAKANFIEMTQRWNGLDYRWAERFLIAKEILRQEVLSYSGQQIALDCIIGNLLNKDWNKNQDIPLHIQRLIKALEKLPKKGKAQWFDVACRVMEEIYANMNA
jgi:hypothetical protein